MPPPEIPIELQEHVLDHLHDDQETLKSCNLVCRAWTWKSRRYFWRVVNPEKRRHCIRLLSILEETAQLGACVGDFVEEFRLPKMGFPRRHSQSDLRCELLRSTARYFPMLKFLNVKEFSITSFLNHLRSEDEAFNMQEAVSSILDFRHLKAIQYDSVTVSDLDDLLQFHGAFPTVSALYMHRVDTKNNENWMGDPLNTTSIQDFVARHRDGRICIEDLTGCICDIPVGRLSQFLNTLTAPPFELRIKRLSWAMAPHRWGSFLPILLHMFRRAESTLEHFELPFSADDSYVTMFWPSRHHRLKTLAFSFYFPTYVTPVWAYVSMWLQWVNPTSLPHWKQSNSAYTTETPLVVG
ncbi:uncharacterized protein C8Q71DRAFT_534699 [Rhodofomes roseus]|uniref:F-box domain-containing protein n=1 Tax=Rhodofomes roseus TaxID=34475 RepID=A0ABQ8KK59_9APHY|nr:uncharacterized protein C8Q71DRAFT_534699 [Rhodofomes roseus]KAH9838534.1 hypothetical protein C8Q71DRAFT_534699 [Rhodofomes roseus]